MERAASTCVSSYVDWALTRARLVRDLQHRWRNISGMLGGVQATLLDVGWDPIDDLEWMDDLGQMWKLSDAAGDIQVFVNVLRTSFTTCYWRSAANHRDGGGTGSEVVIDQIQRHIASLRRRGKIMDAGLLAKAACASLWPAKRSLEAEDVDAALAHFAAAKNAVMEYSGPDLSGRAPSVQYFTVIQQHIHAPSLHTEYVFARVLGFE